MNISHEIIGISWLAFFLAWVVLAMVYSGGGRGYYSSRAIGGRLIFVVAIILGLRFAGHVPDQTFRGQVLFQQFSTHSAVLSATGAVLCVIGLVFATWARVVLGRNWGMPMTIHENPELITSGPYRFVRHPIYTGLIAMWLGTLLVYPVSILPCAVIIAYSLFSALREERDMEQRFPEAYPEYRKRSKMLLPFLI